MPGNPGFCAFMSSASRFVLAVVGFVSGNLEGIKCKALDLSKSNMTIKYV